MQHSFQRRIACSKIREVSFRNLVETMSGLCYVHGEPTIINFSHNFHFHCASWLICKTDFFTFDAAQLHCAWVPFPRPQVSLIGRVFRYNRYVSSFPAVNLNDDMQQRPDTRWWMPCLSFDISKAPGYVKLRDMWTSLKPHLTSLRSHRYFLSRL